MISRVIQTTKVDHNAKKAPELLKSEVLLFGLCSTSDDQLHDPSNESQPKCKIRAPKSSKNEMLIFGLHSTSDEQQKSTKMEGNFYERLHFYMDSCAISYTAALLTLKF